MSGPVNGRPLVFAHGFGCDQNMWRHVAPAFANDYRVVLFDHVGAGGSDHSAYSRAKYDSLHGYANDVLEICRELELHDVVFVGHSVSAIIGVLAATKEPERFAAGPRRPVTALHRRRRLRRRVHTRGHRGSPRLAREQLPGLVSAFAPVIMGTEQPPELQEELTNSFCRTDPEIARDFARVTFLSDNRADLRNVVTPTLVLQCSDDVIAPQAVGEYVHDQVPGSDARADACHGALSEPERPRGNDRRDQRLPLAARWRHTADPDETAALDDATLLEEDAAELYEHAPAGYLSTLPGGLLVKLNETLLAWTGYRRDELIGRKRSPRPARAGRADLLRDALRPAPADAGRGEGDRRRAPTRRRHAAAGTAQLEAGARRFGCGPHRANDDLQRLGTAPVRAGTAARSRGRRVSCPRRARARPCGRRRDSRHAGRAARRRQSRRGAGARRARRGHLGATRPRGDPRMGRRSRARSDRRLGQPCGPRNASPDAPRTRAVARGRRRRVGGRRRLHDS